METVIIIYILLLVVFLVISSLILRHAVKFSYLSTSFKYIVGAFAIISIAVISFSVFLLLKMDTGSTPSFDAGTPSVPAVNNSGSLNF
jgi:hypothetical protein